MASASSVWLFAGLGNPGSEYKDHRHNIGFMAVDAIASRHNFPAWRAKFEGLTSEGRIGAEKIVLLKPQTFMNLSGQSVGAAAKFFKATPDRIAVFHDELDIPAGRVRVKQGGGNAGHNGLRSIDAHLGTPDYWRIRLGIGHPGDKARVTGHVLGNFAKSDQDWLAALLDRVAVEAPLLADGKMTQFASRVGAETP